MVASGSVQATESNKGRQIGPPKLNAFATFQTWLLMFKIFLVKFETGAFGVFEDVLHFPTELQVSYQR